MIMSCRELAIWNHPASLLLPFRRASFPLAGVPRFRAGLSGGGRDGGRLRLTAVSRRALVQCDDQLRGKIRRHTILGQKQKGQEGRARSAPVEDEVVPILPRLVRYHFED